MKKEDIYKMVTKEFLKSMNYNYKIELIFIDNINSLTLKYKNKYNAIKNLHNIINTNFNRKFIILFDDNSTYYININKIYYIWYNFNF